MDILNVKATGHAILAVAHHKPANLGDRNYGLVIGVEYLAAVLEQRGWVVDLICGPQGERDLEEYLRAKSADFVGISSTTSAWPHAMKLGEVARRTAPDVPIIVGGVHASIYGGEILRRVNVFDVVVKGEGEEIIDEIASGMQFADIRGIAFRQKNKVVETLDRASITDLDSLPWPVRGRFGSRFRMEEYFGIYPQINLGETTYAAYILTARGCNRGCRFCRDGHTPIRSRSVENVLEEIEFLARNGIKYLDFCTPNLFHDVRSLKFFADCLKRHGIQWQCFARPEDMTDDVCQWMADSGCVLVDTGVESILPELRHLYGKKGTVDAVRKGLVAAKHAGLRIRADIILGPIAGWAYAKREIDFLIDLGVDFLEINPLTYMPGTDLWRQAFADGRISDDWAECYLEMWKVEDGIEAEDFHAAVAFYYRHFYYRPIYLGRQMIDMLFRNRFPGKDIELRLVWIGCTRIVKAVLYRLIKLIRGIFKRPRRQSRS